MYSALPTNDQAIGQLTKKTYNLTWEVLSIIITVSRIGELVVGRQNSIHIKVGPDLQPFEI